MAEVRLLSAAQLWAADQELDLGPPKQRAVFAALVVDAGHPVPVDTLVDRVWDDAPPAEARNALYVYIRGIRRILVRANATDGSPVRLDRRAGGYVIDIDRDRIDLHRFHHLVEQARAGRWEDGQRVVLLREALGLWRGTPVADLSGAWFARLREGWRQHWLDAVVAWAQVELRLGNHDTVIARLHDVVVDHPLVEPLAIVLMQALHAAGRGAEALDRYAATRARLADQLGTDPGPSLQQVHQAILRGDIGPPSTDRVTAEPADRQVPRQLPTPPQAFTGRMSELATLDRLQDASTVVISAIDGMAGVGKTALAVHAAHRIADRYPDGQLFIDLHGHTPGLAPREPAEALDQLLRALGVPGTQIPLNMEERAGLYRTRLADQRMLIVLDNAAAEAQVVPLLPGASGCLVLVTSRHRLAGLDHTYSLSLDTLPTSDGVALFVQTAGADRLGTQPPDLLVELVQLCGWLPLAIRIAAARLRSRPAWNLSHLVQRLRDQQHRLTELEAGQRSVTAALDLSYQHLGAEAQRAYRLLGLHPGPEIDTYAVAALLDSTTRYAARLVGQLIDAHLLQEPVAGRYRFHDLTRAHAAHTAAAEEPQPTRSAASNRLLDHFRHVAALAMDAAYPYEREHRPQVPPAHTPSPHLSDPAAGRGWLDTELSNLMSITVYATERGLPDHVLHLSAILNTHLRSRGRYRDAEALHHRALATARAAGRRVDELNALNALGDIHRLLYRKAHAADCYQQASRIARAIGNRRGEMNALSSLGQIQLLQGQYAPAAVHFGQTLRIARSAGDRAGEMHALKGLGEVHRLQGQYAQASDCFGRALQIAQATGHSLGERNALTGLGRIHRLLGQYAQATDCFGRALRIAQAAGHSLGEMNALTVLGDIHRVQGRYEEAGDHYHQLLKLAHETGDRNFEFETQQGLGRLRHATGDPDAAITHHDQALALANGLDQPLDQARAHDGLAHAHYALNQHERARQHWQHALNILTELGIDHTDDEQATAVTIRARLANLDQNG